MFEFLYVYKDQILVIIKKMVYLFSMNNGQYHLEDDIGHTVTKQVCLTKTQMSLKSAMSNQISPHTSAFFILTMKTLISLGICPG